MQRVVVREFGKPPEVATLETLSAQLLKPGEVRVQMHFAPINPADLNFLEGTYGIRPELPSSVGNEGIGTVSEIGSAVNSCSVGDLVMPMGGLQCWATQLCLPEAKVVVVPKNTPLQTAAQLRVNPITAYAMLEDFGELHAGDWIVQNAANSAVGLSVIQLAALKGVCVLSFVRSESAAALCRSYGAENVIIESPTAAAEAKEILQVNTARLALNAVGGDSALRLAGLLGDEAKHITYGAMSRQKLTIPNRFLIFQEIQFLGFWLTPWLKRQPMERVRSIYQILAQYMVEAQLRLPVAASYPLTQLRVAIEHASQSQRNGKVLIDLQNLSS